MIHRISSTNAHPSHRFALAFAPPLSRTQARWSRPPGVGGGRRVGIVAHMRGECVARAESRGVSQRVALRTLVRLDGESTHWAATVSSCALAALAAFSFIACLVRAET